MNRVRVALVVALALSACTSARPLDLRAVAGQWRMTVMPEDRDTVLASYQLWTTADTIGWRVQFDGRSDTIPVHVVAVKGDSIMLRVGPYASALRPGVTVEARSIYRLIDGRLVGRSVSRYSVATADSVRVSRNQGRRVQPD